MISKIINGVQETGRSLRVYNGFLTVKMTHGKTLFHVYNGFLTVKMTHGKTLFHVYNSFLTVKMTHGKTFSDL